MSNTPSDECFWILIRELSEACCFDTTQTIIKVSSSSCGGGARTKTSMDKGRNLSCATIVPDFRQIGTLAVSCNMFDDTRLINRRMWYNASFTKYCLIENLPDHLPSWRRRQRPECILALW